MHRSQPSRSWPHAALLAGGLLLPMWASALDIDYRDGFDGTALDPNWWTSEVWGDSTLAVTGGRLVLTQGSSLRDGASGVGLAIKPLIVGDFTATVDYTLLTWTHANEERLVLNAFNTPADQLGLLRTSAPQYDPVVGRPPGHEEGEVYLTAFTGQGILGTPTDDRSGTLRLQRIGDTVTGSFRAGLGWQVIGTYAVAGESLVGRSIGLGLFALPSQITAGTQVALDNFTLTTAVPEPQSWALWLTGAALLGARARRSAPRAG
jgi:hypothetical protein